MLPKLFSKHEISAAQLCIERNAPINLFDFADKDGKKHVFFTCGSYKDATGSEKSYTIYGSPAAVKRFQEPDAKIEDFKFAEISKDGKEFVPCLMVVGASHTAVKTMGMELLRKQ